jgi:hypothetical protein
MTRDDKLRFEARQRRLNKESKKSAMDRFYPSQLDQMVGAVEKAGERNTADTMAAFTPEYMFDTDLEAQEAWEESGVMDNFRKSNG